MEGAGVCLTISTEHWLCRERDSGGVGTTGKPQKSWSFLFSFFPLVSPGNCKHLGQRIQKISIINLLLTCFSVKTTHNLIVLIS